MTDREAVALNISRLRQSSSQQESQQRFSTQKHYANSNTEILVLEI